jgi:hypothetical protein
MKEQDFNCRIFTSNTTKEAFDAITRVSEWWAKNVEGNTQKLDAVFTVRFGETSSVIKTVEVVPEKKILWKVMDCNLPIFKNVKDWNDTQMSWEISTENNLTQISFTHIGLIPGKECYNDCSGGWTFFVKESLFKLLTEGKGLPGIGIRSTISYKDRTYRGTLFLKNDPLPDLPEQYILIDVNEIEGEHVISANSVELLNKKTFNTRDLQGKCYMIVENKVHFKNANTLQDIHQTIKTNKMKKQDYTATIVANVTKKIAFDAITAVGKWWTENIEGNTENLNDVFTVHFGETFATFKVVESIKEQKLAWLVTDCYLHWLKDKKEWKGTTLDFDLTAENDSTKITFTHIGLQPEIECYNDCRKGWDQYVKDSLLKLITEGQGRPEKKQIQTA